jgi:hypothetical protein
MNNWINGREAPEKQRPAASSFDVVGRCCTRFCFWSFSRLGVRRERIK